MDVSRTLAGWPLALGTATAFTGTDWALVAVLIVALCLAALSAAAETALTSVSRIRIRNAAEDGDPKAQRILRLLEKPEAFLSAILVMGNVSVIAASTVGAILAVDLFGPVIGGIASTVGISLIVLIFAEITPKTAAVQAPERGARLLIGPVESLSKLLSPLVHLLTFITHGIVRLFAGGPVRRGPFVTEEELRMLVEVGEQEGVLEEEEREMIHNVFELADTTVREVMVPRIDMITIAADATVDDAIKVIVEGGQSRIPVYTGDLDDIIGVLYAKDLLRVLARKQRPTSVRALVRKAYFVPESKRLDDLLREMQNQRVHMAIVVDEYGSVAGLVTIEDLVEEIIGDIKDEYDKEEQLIRRVGDDEYVVDAKVPLDELNEELDSDLTSEDYETLGGFVYAQLDKIPTPGDVVRYDGLTMTVLGTRGRRITTVRIVRTPESPAPDATANDPAVETGERPAVRPDAEPDAPAADGAAPFVIAEPSNNPADSTSHGYTEPPELESDAATATQDAAPPETSVTHPGNGSLGAPQEHAQRAAHGRSLAARRPHSHPRRR